MDNNSQILVLRDNAQRELMKIKSVEDGITYLNKLKSIEVWVKAEKKDAELQNLVAEQKLRTQRILGELIAEGQRKGVIATPEDNRYSTGNKAGLVEVGLTKNQSSAFQQIASIPEDNFEAFIEDRKQAVNRAVSELTTTGAVRLAQSLNNKKQNNEHTKRDPELELEVKELLERINALPIFYRIKIKQGIKRC